MSGDEKGKEKRKTLSVPQTFPNRQCYSQNGIKKVVFSRAISLMFFIFQEKISSPLTYRQEYKYHGLNENVP